MKKSGLVILILLLTVSFASAEGKKEKLPENSDAPSFVLADLAGNYVFLRDYCGETLRKPYKNKIHHVVVVSFFASWCVPCKSEIPHLNNLYQRYKEKPVKMFLVNVGEDKEKINSFLQTNPTDIPVLSDRYKATADKYKVTTLPRLVVIDKKGKIKRYNIGFANDENFEEEMSKLLDSLLTE